MIWSYQIKKIICLLIVGCSLSIAVLGLLFNANRQQHQKVDYAELTIQSEEEKMNKFSKMMDSYFNTDKKIFLTSTIDMSEIAILEKEVNLLKVSALDFDLEEEDITFKTTELVTKKKELLQRINEIKVKQEITEQIKSLLTEIPEGWTIQQTDVSIAEQTTLADILTIKSKVSDKENEWDSAVMKLLEEMELQINQYTELNDSLDQLLSKDGVPYKVNDTDIWLLSNQVERIKNERLKNNLMEKLEEIELQMIQGSI